MLFFSAFICGELKEGISREVRASFPFIGFHTQKSVGADTKNSAISLIIQQVVSDISVQMEMDISYYLDVTIEEIEQFESKEELALKGPRDIGYLFYTS